MGIGKWSYKRISICNYKHVQGSGKLIVVKTELHNPKHQPKYICLHLESDWGLSEIFYLMQCKTYKVWKARQRNTAGIFHYEKLEEVVDELDAQEVYDEIGKLL